MSTGFIEAKAPSDKRREGPSAESPIFTSRLIAVMAAVCLAALALAAFGRLTGVGVQKLPQSDAVLQRELRFLDAPGGVIVIQDASDGAVVHKVVPGDGGFIRTVIRGMAHERMARGGDASTPFSLALRADNRLTITDPITRREIILDSFGGPNRDVFARLLPARKTSENAAAGAARDTGGTR